MRQILNQICKNVTLSLYERIVRVIIRRKYIMGEEGRTDKQYASILLDEIAELEEQIKLALEEGAVKTAAGLTKIKERKEEKLKIILGKR